MSETVEILDIGNSCRSVTYKKETCKSLYITLVYREDEPEKIDYVLISSTSKDNNCSNSLLDSLALMTSFSIRRIRNEHEARAIVKNLRGAKCLACPPNKCHTTNCADALGQVLQEVLFKDEKTPKQE